MSDLADRVLRLEQEVAELRRQVAGVPVRLGDTSSGSGTTEVLGCYLQRVGGKLTLDFGAIFGEGFEVGDEEPCPLIHNAGVEGPEGPQGDPGTPGTDGEDGTDAILLSAGYCITLEVIDAANKIIHNDMITSDAGTDAVNIDLNEFQFWGHEPGATVRTDQQHFTLNDWDDTKTQLVGHINGVWWAKTLGEWLVKLTGHVPGNDQSIGHDVSGDPEWQDDDDECP